MSDDDKPVSKSGGYGRLKGLMEDSGHHLVLHEPSDRQRRQMEADDKATSKRLAERSVDDAGNKKPLYEYTNVAKVSIRESAPDSGLIDDQIRIELKCGRTLLVTGSFHRIDVLGPDGESVDVIERRALPNKPPALEKQTDHNMSEEDMVWFACKCGNVIPLPFDAAGFISDIHCGKCGEQGQFTSTDKPDDV